jgi:ribonuclease D
MSFVLIEEPGQADRLARALSAGQPVALDCEAAGFHRYTDRLCLVQLTTADGTDFIIDPLAVDAAEMLGPTLEDPAVDVLMHGADFDVRLLERDLGIHLRGLFDTQVAAALLGEPALGLAALLERYLGVTLSKKYQRADWAKRPLPEAMLDYAASDTRYLHQLVALVRDRLESEGRMSWAEEEFRSLENVRFEPETDQDPVVRVKGARGLEPRVVAALREALVWRDEVAREQDRAPFRVAQDQVLMEIAAQRPGSVEALANMKGMSGRLARESGRDLVNRLERLDTLVAEDLEAYPPPQRNGPGRPPPEVEALAERLKTVRNQRAEALGLDRGALVSNALLLEIAREAPRTIDALTRLPGMKRWQVEALGPGLMEVLAGR